MFHILVGRRVHDGQRAKYSLNCLCGLVAFEHCVLQTSKLFLGPPGPLAISWPFGSRVRFLGDPLGARGKLGNPLVYIKKF